MEHCHVNSAVVSAGLDQSVLRVQFLPALATAFAILMRMRVSADLVVFPDRLDRFPLCKTNRRRLPGWDGRPLPFRLPIGVILAKQAQKLSGQHRIRAGKVEDHVEMVSEGFDTAR